MAIRYYYQAGVLGPDGTFTWSEHIRWRRATAEAEARQLARRMHGEPAVRWWDYFWGRRPRRPEEVATWTCV